MHPIDVRLAKNPSSGPAICAGVTHRSRKWGLLCVLLVCVPVSHCALGAAEGIPCKAVVSTPARFSAIEEEIRACVTKGEFPSLAIGVVQDGKIIWAETFGWADRERRVAATPQTAYGLASLGKSITATAVMTLVEQGKVGLDMTVGKIIQPDRLEIYEGSSRLISFSLGRPLDESPILTYSPDLAEFIFWIRIG